MTETFGQRLKRLREAKGLTHMDMCKKIGNYHIESIQKIEGDRFDPGALYAFTVGKLASILGVSMEYLYAGVEPAPVADTPGKRIRVRRDELGETFRDCACNAREFSPSLSNTDWLMLEADSLDDEQVEILFPAVSRALGVNVEWILTGSEPKVPEVVKVATKRAGYMVRFLRTMVQENEMSETDTVELSVIVAKGFGRKIVEMIGTGRPIE